uniref:DysbindinAlike [Megachile rotundata] n=2 Tax=Lepeophtheirus salmonis TaxID=72036 RepID=A0A0K2T1P6_LEPSM
MLGHLKVRLASLQEEIVKSLSQGPVNDDPKYIPNGVDLEAGCNLLARYQDDWADIHEANEKNIRLALETDTFILKLKESFHSQWNNISLLQGLVSHIPAINKEICVIMDSLGNLESSFTDVEVALFALEDTIETRKLQEKQLDQRFQIAIYQERRQTEYNDLSTRLQKSYEKQVQELEVKRVLNLPNAEPRLNFFSGVSYDSSLQIENNPNAQMQKTFMSDINLEIVDLDEEEEECEEIEEVEDEENLLEKSELSDTLQTVDILDTKSSSNNDTSFYFTPDSTVDKLESLSLDPKC